MLRDVLAGTPQFAEVRLSALRFSFYFCCNWDESFLWGLKERLCFATVSVTSHHWEAGLRCSECEAGLAADSGEKSLLIFQNVSARRPLSNTVISTEVELLKGPEYLWGGGGAYNLWRWCRVLLGKLRLVSYLTTLDIFQTACVSQYEHKDLAEFLEGLWASLRREVCLR